MEASSEDDLIDTLRLSLVFGVGPRTRKALLERFGTARAVLAAAMSELREVQGVGAKLAHAIADADQIDAEGEVALCREHGIDILTESNRRLSAPAARDSRPARRAVRARPIKAERRPGGGHRRHAARHAIRTAAGRAAGGRIGPSRIDHRQRAGPRNRRRGPSRRAGRRRANHRRAGQRRDEHLPARTRQAGRRGCRPRCADQRIAAALPTAGRHVSATKPD